MQKREFKHVHFNLLLTYEVNLYFLIYQNYPKENNIVCMNIKLVIDTHFSSFSHMFNGIMFLITQLDTFSQEFSMQYSSKQKYELNIT